ncbi:MAG: cation transporter [Nitrospiraceae bacterium]|jgi:periplasmic mercuric ion binding protein
MRRLMFVVVTTGMALGIWTVSASAAEQKVTLMLGGKFCESYLGEVKDSLAKVEGVKDVDLKSMKGHAVVTVDGKTKPDQLAAAVNGVKGDGWHCTAQVMK